MTQHLSSIHLQFSSITGKFGSHYIKREFYFDVHPPLGKILVGVSGVLANYRGDFAFESGAAYPEGLQYIVMRVFLATFGVMMVPLAYLTGLEMRLSNKAAIFMALCVLCGMGMIHWKQLSIIIILQT
jgi:dolichyl-phosphate-mannose-protein mannosyltransferase